MPGPFSLDTLTDHLDGGVDVLICSASFEERCKSIPNRIDPFSIKHVLVCENEDIAEHVGANAEYLRNYFSLKSLPVPLSLNDPLKVADSLAASIDKIKTKAPQRFLVDTTTFSRESLLILLKLLRIRLKLEDRVHFTYASAAEYSVGQETEDKWLSKGIKEIRSVLGYPGDPMPSRKFHLVVLAGFEYERAAKLIDNYESAVVSVGFGDEQQSITSAHFENNVTFHKKLCDLYRQVETFKFSLTDPLQTKKAIQSQIQKKPGYNVVVAALNNKISTIGAALAAFDNSSIQLCYAQANHYNYQSYSSPGEVFFVFEIANFIKPEI